MKKYPLRCPVTAYLGVIDGHWKPLLPWHLQTKPLRLKDFLLRLPGISGRVLIQQCGEAIVNRIKKILNRNKRKTTIIRRESVSHY